MNKVITDIKKPDASFDRGSLWKEEEDGELFILAQVDGGIGVDIKYAAISLTNGNRWREQSTSIDHAVGGLTLIAKEATITVSSLVK